MGLYEVWQTGENGSHATLR